MNLLKYALSATVASMLIICLEVGASSNGGDSERQSLLTINDDSYTVLSIERLGHFTYWQFTNRISLKHYSIRNNLLISTDVLMESQINASAKIPPDPSTVTTTDTQLTTLQSVFGDRIIGFEGYVRKPKYKLKVSADGIFMDKNGKRTIVVPSSDLRKRIPDYLALAEYNAFEVIGIQGWANSHYFVVVRSNEWGSDIGSFEQVIAVPSS